MFWFRCLAVLELPGAVFFVGMERDARGRWHRISDAGRSDTAFLSFHLPQPDDLDDSLGLIAGQLKVMLQRIGGGVPVVAQGGIQNFQMLLTGLILIDHAHLAGHNAETGVHVGQRFLLLESVKSS